MQGNINIVSLGTTNQRTSIQVDILTNSTRMLLQFLHVLDTGRADQNSSSDMGRCCR
jgi:hypothetical protein